LAAQTHKVPGMLINCVAYQNGQKLGDIAVADIHDTLLRPDPATQRNYGTG